MSIQLSVTKQSLGILPISQTEGSVPFVDSNGDLVEDNANLFWDDANNRLGIGTASPNAPLEVNADSPGSVGGFPSGALHVKSPSTAVNANSIITGHNSFGGNKQLWYLGSTSGSTDNIALINRQNAALSLSTNSLTRMTIDNLGNIGIGVSSPDVLTHIQASVSAARAIQATAQLVVEKNDDAGIQIITPATKKGALHFGDAISDVGGIVYDHNTDDMIIRTAGADRVTIDNAGNVVHNNFTKLGSDAPVVRMKKLTGTTGATEGSTTNIAHGLTLSKIIGLSVLIVADNGNLIPPGLVFTTEFEYDMFLTSTNVAIRLSDTNSGNLLSNAITVLLTYEE